jgi:Family of unknown function (DUF6529)
VTAAAPVSPSPPARSARWLFLPLAAFALVALTAGLLARAHPDEGGYFDLIFSDTIHMKVWLASAAVALAVTQPVTAAWIFGRLPWPRPRWVAPFHRWTGRVILALTLPVAYHCIFLLGFQSGSDRTLAHSLLGCAVYGAFASKVLIVRLHRFPWWVLPTAGGLLFAILIALWYTSALWFFRTVDVVLLANTLTV